MSKAGGGGMATIDQEHSDFDCFLTGLCVIAVILLIILALPIGIFAAVYLGFLKRIFFS